MTAMRLKRYPSPSGGIALGKIGAGATMMWQGYTARDYVQDGLVALWDGIENAGWGIHTNSFSELREIVTGAPLTATVENPSIGNIVIGDSYFDFTRTDNTTLNSRAFLSCEIPNLATLVSSNAVCTYECCIIPDTSNLDYYKPYAQAWGFSWDIAERRIRRWWQDATLCCGFNAQLCRSDVQGNQGTSALLWWKPKRHHALVCAAGSSLSNAYYFVDGARYNRFSRFWDGQSAVSNMVTFGTVFTSSAGIYPSRVYRLAIYSRALTAAEIAANYAVDKARFNLPDAN